MKGLNTSCLTAIMDSVRSGRLGREKVFLQRRLSLEQSK